MAGKAEPTEELRCAPLSGGAPRPQKQAATTLTPGDREHSFEEDRQIMLGMTSAGRLAVVVFSESQDTIRVISARKATRKEARQYSE